MVTNESPELSVTSELIAFIVQYGKIITKGTGVDRTIKLKIYNLPKQLLFEMGEWIKKCKRGAPHKTYKINIQIPNQCEVFGMFPTLVHFGKNKVVFSIDHYQRIK